MKKGKRILPTLMALILCLSTVPAMTEAPAAQASLSGRQVRGSRRRGL